MRSFHFAACFVPVALLLATSAPGSFAQCNNFPDCFNYTAAKTALVNALNYHVYSEVVLNDLGATIPTISNNINYNFVPVWIGGVGKTAISKFYQDFIFRKDWTQTQPPNVTVPANFGPDVLDLLKESYDITGWDAATGLVNGSVIQEYYGNFTFAVRNDLFLPGYVPKKPFRIYARWIQRSTIVNNQLDQEFFFYDAWDLIMQSKIIDKMCYWKKYFASVAANKVWRTLFSRFDVPVPFRTAESFEVYDHDDCH